MQLSVKISSIGLSSVDHSILKVVTGLLEKQNIYIEHLHKDNTSGEIALVDVDTTAGQEFYEHFDVDSGQILLLFSTKMLNEQHQVVILKPVRVQTLRDVLHDICKERLGHTNVDEQKPDKTGNTELVYSKNNLFFTLINLKREKGLFQVFCHPYSPLFIDSEQGIIATSMPRETLRKIARSPIMLMRSTTLSRNDFDILVKGQVILPLDNVLWSTGLYGSQGKLLEGHLQDVPVQLKQWPNLSRLDFDPEHLTLASLMTGQVLTLRQVEQKSNLPWRTVVGFYNAAAATDLIVINPNDSTKVITAKKTPAKIGLFSKIAHRLGFNLF